MRKISKIGLATLSALTIFSASGITQMSPPVSASSVETVQQYETHNSVMIDVSRRHMTKDQIIDFINNVDPTQFKYVQLHLNDDEGFAVKTNILHNQGWLSKSDIKAIDRAANKRGLVIVPDIDVPAHAGGIVTALRNTNSNWLNHDIIMNDTTLDYTNPDTLNFVKQLYRETLSCFDDKELVVIGADEVPGNGSNAGSFTTFLNGLDNYVQRLGYHSVVWNDSLNNDVLQQLDRDIIVAYWNPDSDANNTEDSLRQAGFTVKDANYDYSYFNTVDLNNRQLRREKAQRFAQNNQNNNMLCLWGGGDGDNHISNKKVISYLKQVQDES